MPLQPVISYSQFTSAEVTFLASLADLGWQNGDLYYYNNGPQRLGKGSNGQVLSLSAGLPSWVGSSAGIVGNFNFQTPATGTANGSNTVFTFSNSIGIILLNGIIQQPGGADITLNSSTQATFVASNIPAQNAVVLNLYLT